MEPSVTQGAFGFHEIHFQRSLTMNAGVIGSGLMVIGLVVAMGGVCSAGDEKDKTEKGTMLSHDVYFSLQDNSPEAKEKLIDACHKYLSGHPGTIWFAAGARGEEFQRDVNDQGFDVGLHIVFKSKAAHDQYAEDERHLKFIELTKPNWKQVRVFDSYITASSHAEMPAEGDKPDKPKKSALPDGAAGFAGMVRVTVVQKLDVGLVVKVGEVAKLWEANKAQDPKSLIGKTILVQGGKGEGNIARFLKTLKTGEEVALDVADKGGGALTILELTEEQRERAKGVEVEK
jgi:hypothetical protein